MLEFKLFIYYGSYLIFPIIIYTIYETIKRKKQTIRTKFCIIFMLLFSVFFIDNRYIETNIITVSTTKIDLNFKQDIKIALISDIHLWIYKKEDFLEKIVKRINEIENLDYVLIAWDLTYFEEKQENLQLEKLFKPLKELNRPTFWVFWNHDLWFPWPEMKNKLTKVLNKYNITLLNNEIVELKWFKLVWLWSYFAWEDKINLLNNLSKEDNIVVLTHNPDTTSKYTNNNTDLTLCWHTHWWQIRIPFLYKIAIPTNWDFDEWLTEEKYTKLFITSWLWLTGLPFRFLNPPVIDILEIK